MALSGFNHTVNWNEFRPVNERPAGTPEDAHIKTIYTSNFSMHQTGGENCEVTTATVAIRSERSNTWVVRDRKRPDLLGHEQGHYNITALGAREYYNHLLELTAPHCSNINSQAQTLIQQIKTHIDETDIRYDSQTANGTNQSVQRKWDASIRSAMQRPDGTLYDLP